MGKIENLDFKKNNLRKINNYLQNISYKNNKREFTVKNPSGHHAICAGLTENISVKINGHVGYYCGGMNQKAHITINGNAGTGLGENMMSGLIHVDRGNRKINMRMFVNRLAEDLIDVSKGGKVLENIGKGKLNRYRVLGLEDKELVALAKEFTEGKNVISYKNYLGRRVMQFDFVNFKDQNLVRRFAIAVNRYTKRTVQYNLIGDTSRFFSDRALGKTMGQFRQFIMTAWGKQFLHNVAMGDLTTFAMFMNTIMLGGLAYVAQANFNAIGMSEKEKKAYLKKKLGSKGEYNKIAIAAFQRAGWSSMMPPYIDMMMGVVSPENRFNTRSSGMETDLVNGNPTTDLIKKLGKVAGNGLRAGFRSDYDFSKQDLNRIMRLFPYQNLYGVNQMLNFLRDNSGLPDKSKRQLY